MALTTNAVLDGTVVKITGFGAFIQLEENRVGMVHISEIANTYVRDINDHLKLGDSVRVVILGTDESGRINLSVRRANPAPAPVYAPQPRRETPASFDDMLSRFLKDSEERQLDYKRATGRKGGGYSRSRG